MEKRNDEYEDNEEHDENIEAIEMNENKEALITEKIFWNEGDFRKKILVWNRLNENNFVLVVYCILIIVIFCHFSLLCLKMAPGGLKLVAAIKHLAVKRRV